MIKLKEIYDIYKEIESSKTFGGLYKTNYYSLDLINLFISIPITLIEEELNIKNDRLISELEDKSYYQTLLKIIDALETKKIELEPKTNYLTIENNKLKLKNPNDIEVGSLVDIFDVEYNNIGKAVIVTVEKSKNLATLNYFLTDINSDPRYAYFSKWWDILPQEVLWLRPDLLLSNSVASALLEVSHNLDKYKIGRVQWELYYTQSSNEILLAKGVDIIRPGLISIYKKEALFNSGNYRLVIIDRRVMYNSPFKKELTWNITEPTSKLINYG